MKTDKLTKVYIYFNAILFIIVFGYIIKTDFIHKKVDNISYASPKTSFMEKVFNHEDVYYVKLYKDKIGENRYKFNRIEISEDVEEGFININNCRFKRFTVINENGFVNFKMRNQNLYEKVYTTIPKNNMIIIVSDYFLTVEITDIKKLSSFLGIYKKLTLKPIELRIWLNIRNKEMNENLLDRTNEHLDEVGLKITGYTKL
jgi:hypothetical protein